MLDTLRELALGVHFQAGLRLGLPAFLVGLVLGIFSVRRRGHPSPVVGLFLAVGTLVALSVADRASAEIWGGAALLALGGVVAGRLPARWLTDPLLAAPGAVLIALGSELPGPVWVPIFALGAILLSAPLVASFDHHHRKQGLGPALLAISVLGVFATVPDTKAALVLAGVALPLAFLGWPLAWTSLGRAGSYAAVGIVFWVIVQGGHTRPGSIIGATASLGLLILEPMVRWLRGTTLLDRLTPDWKGTLLAGLLQLPLVLLASRWAGFQQEAIPAAVMALAVALAAALFISLISLRPQAPAA